VGRDGVELLFVLTQVLGQGFEALGTFLKVELQQIGQAHGTGEVHRITKINRLGMGLEYRGPIDGAAQILCALLADPLATDETLQDLGHGKTLSVMFKPSQLELTNRAVGKF
jgi:hypothetical protein